MVVPTHFAVWLRWGRGRALTYIHLLVAGGPRGHVISYNNASSVGAKHAEHKVPTHG